MHIARLRGGMRTICVLLAVAMFAGCTGGEPTTDATPTQATATPAATATPTASATPTATPSATPASTPTPTQPAATTVGVDIRDFAYHPPDVIVARGTDVVWTNREPTGGHTVTADDDSFNSGDLRPGEAFTQRFDAAGTYAYHCAYHPEMSGTVTVA